MPFPLNQMTFLEPQSRRAAEVRIFPQPCEQEGHFDIQK